MGTFDEYLNWAIGHIAGKIQDYRAGNRYQPPAPAVIHTAPAVTYSAAPMTYAAAPTVMHSSVAPTVVSSLGQVAYWHPSMSTAGVQFNAPVHYGSPTTARR